MDTFELLPVLAQGELGQTSAPELVAAIFRSRASGTLSLEEGKEEVRLFFRAGDPCGAARPTGFRTLAQILLTHNLLAPELVEKASALSSTEEKRLGEVLIEGRMMTREQLHGALALQHRENLRLLLQRNVGRYDWRGWEPPPAWATEVAVDPVRGVLEALVLPQFSGRRAAVLRWLGETPVKASVDFAEIAQKAEMLLADRRAAEQFASPIPLAAWFAEAGLARPRAEALLVTLLLVGGVEPLPPESAQPLDASLFEPAVHPPVDVEEVEVESAAPEVVEAEVVAEQTTEGDEPGTRPTETDPALLAAEAEIASAEIVREAEPELAEPLPPIEVGEPIEESQIEPIAAGPDLLHTEVAEVAAEHDLRPVEVGELVAEAQIEPFAAELVADAPPIESIEPPDAEEPMDLVQPVGAPAPAPDPFSSSRRRSGADLLFDGRPDDPVPELEARPATPTAPAVTDERARSLRKKLLARGLRNMGALGAPEEPFVIQGGIALDEGPGEPPGKARPEGLPPLTDEEKCFLEDARARARVVPKQDAYARLGVPQNASQDQIRTAYHGLVKKFHPDRANTPALAAASADLESLFQALRDAYECIGSPQSRAAYDGSGRGGATGGTRGRASRTEDAGLAIKKGEVYLKKRDFESALRELRRAVDLEGGPAAMTALAWGELTARGPEGREEATRLINRALREGATSRTHYVAGVLKRLTDPEEAARHFRKAVEMDKKNSDAALELRLLDRRKEKNR